MKNITLRNLALPIAATTLTVATIANAAITPAFPTISETFAVDGQIIHADDINKLAKGINNLDQRAWAEGTGHMSAPNNSEFVVTDDGKVGVGTTGPRQALQVFGKFNLGSEVFTGAGHRMIIRDDTGNLARFYYRDAGNTNPRIDILGEPNKIRLRTAFTSSHADLSLGTFTSPDALTIVENGNVGIGTATPYEKLEVRSSGTGGIRISSDTPGLWLNSLDTGGESWAILNPRNAWGTPDGSFLIKQGSVNLERFIIDSSGNVGIGTATPSTKLHVAGTITEDSDERLKENVKTVENSLEKITQINGFSFDWIDEEKYGDDTTYGILAQEVEAVFPELVYTAEDEMGTKSVNYDGLTAPLIEAIKELKVENEALKALVCLDHAESSVCQ